MNENNYKMQVAECVGLWLAEGDGKTKYEITFTNNCIDLINHFYKTLLKIFPDTKNIRIYIYSNENCKIDNLHYNVVIKNYLDKRARKTYYILRLASVESLKKWKKIVEEICNDKESYKYILRGFFAGEGNIKEGSHNSRGLRISQKNRNKFIEEILEFFSIKKFKFRVDDRSYYIYGKYNWDIFANLKLAELHPDKKQRFWKVYNEFKQDHYENNYLKNNILLDLKNPQLKRDLSKKYQRSFARIEDILIDLKKQEKILNFRVGSIDYWTNNKNAIIISKIKKNYLIFLDKPRKTSEFSKKFNVNYKSSLRRLEELQKLNLVLRNKDNLWEKVNIKKEIITLE